MSTVELHCESCAHKLTAEARLRGMIIPCPNCGADVKVALACDRDDDDQDLLDVAREQAAEEARPGPRQAHWSLEDERPPLPPTMSRCVDCGAPVSRVAALCPKCGSAHPNGCLSAIAVFAFLAAILAACSA